MTVLSDVEIEKYIGEGSLVITPFNQSSLNGAGYDLRSESEVSISPGQSRLVATLERVELSENLAGTLHIRSSLARDGIIASLALVDPGFRGQLTISLFNGGSEQFVMKRGDGFVQIVLHVLNTRTGRSYRGRYQDSKGVVERRGRTH
jgi:dCTP deaminase